MRIGSVPYINALPLTYGLDAEVVKLPPVALAKLLGSGKLDVAVAPSATLFGGHGLSVVPGICIGSDGPVKSVRLYHSCEISKIRKVAVDIESKTGALLVRVILAEKYGTSPEYVASPRGDLGESAEDYDAELLIGDKALAHDERLGFIDLGEEWKELTGLPFVFAFWVVRSGFEDPGLIGKLTRAKEEGLENLDEIIEGLPGIDPEALREYLSDNIKYDLNDDYLEGFRAFNKSLLRMGLVEREFEVRMYGAGTVAQST